MYIRILFPYDKWVKKTILHIDFDSFFASVEQQYNPFFRGKPLGVTAENGRTCIIASSKEAKKLGINTGIRTYEAYQKYPALLLTPADFRKYFEVSKKFLRIAGAFSPAVELFSIDEVFMDVTETLHLFGGVDSLLRKIKEKIALEIGPFITVSIGISHNKLLAKLASGLKKPDGIFFIGENDVQAVYEQAKLTDICGIGKRVEKRLNYMGIYTLLQLRGASLSSLTAEFGPAKAEFLHRVGFGIDQSMVIPFTKSVDVKSVSRNHCLEKNEYDKRKILQTIFELCEEISHKLRKLEKKTRTISLCLSGNISLSERKTFSPYIDSGRDIFAVCSGFYDKHFWQKEDFVRQISVHASGLADDSCLTSSLFENPKITALQTTIDDLNERFGDHTIRNGFLLYSQKLTTMPNGYSKRATEV